MSTILVILTRRNVQFVYSYIDIDKSSTLTLQQQVTQWIVIKFINLLHMSLMFFKYGKEEIWL